jgi:hypothetical protein
LIFVVDAPCERHVVSVRVSCSQNTKAKMKTTLLAAVALTILTNIAALADEPLTKTVARALMWEAAMKPDVPIQPAKQAITTTIAESASSSFRP